MSDTPVNGDLLKSFAERMQRLDERKGEISEDLKEFNKEVKDEGFEKKWFDHCFKLRRMDPEQRLEISAKQEIYLDALGIQPLENFDGAGDIDSDRLISFLDRRENLEDQKENVAEEIKDLKSEIKEAGYELKFFSYAYAQFQMDSDKRQDQELIKGVYEAAAGF